MQLLKPTCLEPVLCNKRSHRNEKPTHRNEEQPLLAATRESLHAAKKTQCSQKFKKKNGKLKWNLQNHLSAQPPGWGQPKLYAFSHEGTNVPSLITLPPKQDEKLASIQVLFTGYLPCVHLYPNPSEGYRTTYQILIDS